MLQGIISSIIIVMWEKEGYEKGQIAWVEMIKYINKHPNWIFKMPEDIPIALELAKKQREIGVAEFFARNRHLLGFDNKRKALMT